MRWAVVAVLVGAVTLAFASPAIAVPVDPERLIGTPAEHNFLQPILTVHERFVRPGGVDYPGLAREHVLLDVVTRAFSANGPGMVGRLSERARIALWIDAYNAFTLDLIVREWRAREGRLQSIKDIPAAWSRPKWTVAGRSVTLDQIEHEILRKDFREPRIHFALVCASRSCPALRIHPYRTEFLDAQLDSAAREFVLDPSRNDFMPRGGAIRISKIFDWYGKDFVGVYSDSTFERLYGRETGAVLAYVARFLPAETVAAFRAKRARVTYLPYDWSLNIAPPH